MERCANKTKSNMHGVLGNVGTIVETVRNGVAEARGVGLVEGYYWESGDDPQSHYSVPRAKD